MADFAKARHARRSPRHRAAMVLVLVLIVVTMIALAGFSFTELMLTENKATHLHGDELRLEHAIGSGVESLRLFCEQPAATQSAAGGLFDNPAKFAGISLAPDERRERRERAATREVRFSIVAPRDSDGQSEGIRFGVENESGRLHLADLLRWDAQQPGSGRKALMNFPGMTDAVADAILDWIDPDSQPREQGAEVEYYAGLEKPYAPRNGLPECLEELLLVKGVTRELLFGADANYNHQLDPEELVRNSSSPRPAANPSATVPWATMLTLYSGQRNLTAEGRPRVDLNSPDLTRLQQQLTEALDANWAAFIIAYRQYGPASGTGTAASGAPPINPTVAARFTIASVLDLVGTKVAIPASAGSSSTPSTMSTPPPPATSASAAPSSSPGVAAIKPLTVQAPAPSPAKPATPSAPTTSASSAQPATQIYDSPLSGDPQALGQQLPKLLDKTTVIPLPVVRGGVSVNHAPRAVLRCVPGLDAALAERIVAARGAQSSPNENARRDPSWLLSEGLVDLTTMKTLLPNLSAGGEVVRAQVVGYFDGGGPSARAEVVLDATTSPARQLSWRDLRFFGRGYPLDWLSDESGKVDGRSSSNR